MTTICRFDKEEKEMARERFTEENIHAVFELRAAGFGPTKIKGFTGLSESSISQIERVAKALILNDYRKALLEMGVEKATRLTQYSVDKIWWTCDANKIPRVNYETLVEEWKALVSERELNPTIEWNEEGLKNLLTCDSLKDVIDNTIDQIKLRTDLDTAVLQTLAEIRDKINSEPILDVLNYINNRIDDYYAE